MADGPPRWTGTDKLVLERIVEIIEAAIAVETNEERRQNLKEDYEDGDFHIQPCDRRGYVLICVGDDDVGEHSLVSLRRPDDPGRN